MEENNKQTEQNKKLLKHTLLFSLFVLSAQVVGLVRDLYMAKVFGVSQVLDVYYMAFKIPDFLNVFYGVFLGSVVFIPLLTAAKNNPSEIIGETGEQKMVKKINVIGSFVMFLIILMSLVLFIFMPYFASVIAPTWDAEQVQLLSNLSRILLLAQLFFPIGILAGSICMIYEKPFFTAVSGAIYNLFILLGSLLLVPFLGIYGVVISVTFAAICFMLVQIYPKEVRNVLRQFSFQINFSEWYKFSKQNMSRFFAVLVYQFFGIVLLYIASFSGPGGVSVFSIAYNIFLALFFILGASLSTASMPSVARLHVEGNREEQKEALNNSIIYIFFVSIFFLTFGLIFSYDIVKILYFYSSIALDKEIMISSLLFILILSLPLFNVLEIVRKYLYSTNQIPFAGFMTIFLLVSVVLSSVFLNKVLEVQILNSLGFAFLFGNFICTLIVFSYLGKRGDIDVGTILKNIYKVVCVSLATFLLSILFSNVLNTFLQVFFANVLINYFFTLLVNSFVVLLLFVILIFVFNDTVGKNILKQLKTYVL